MLNDDETRSAISIYQKKYGTTVTFIANNCGVSREHLSRWINDADYCISNELKRKIKVLITGK